MLKTNITNHEEPELSNLVEKKTKEVKKEKEKAKKKLLSKMEDLPIPKIGDSLSGRILDVSKNVVHVELGPYGIGVVRGPELWEALDTYKSLEVGDEVTAKVLELENEEGNFELSFKQASFDEAWADLKEKKEKEKVICCKIQEANRGGLLSSINGVSAFLPVSQLAPEHYPRVEGGASKEILALLKEFVGQKLNVKIITADEEEEKLIISEKEAALEKEKKKITSLKVGDIIEGEISGITNFGAFMRFDHLEGLVHISELAWQLIENPKDVVKIGQKVKAEIIGLDGTKIFLSIKKLTKDPWKTISKKYKVGQLVMGEVTKVQPFGIFVQLDKDIHGLVHISELTAKEIKSPEEVVKVGQKRKFKILSIEPEEHRMGLSLKAVEGVKKAKKSVTKATRESKIKKAKVDKKEATK